MKQRKHLFVLCVVFTIMFFVSCQSQSVRVYQVPKQKSSKQSSISNQTQIKDTEFLWSVPNRWKVIKENQGGMRLASFEVFSSTNNKKKVDVSVVVLPGSAGGVVANVNRWRGQLGLSSMSKESVKSSVNSILDGMVLGQLNWVLIENGQDAILAGMVDVKGDTLFVKMQGSIDVVKESQPDFLEFCFSLKVK